MSRSNAYFAKGALSKHTEKVELVGRGLFTTLSGDVIDLNLRY